MSSHHHFIIRENVLVAIEHVVIIQKYGFANVRVDVVRVVVVVATWCVYVCESESESESERMELFVAVFAECRFCSSG